jgi:hypothetical protein
MAGPVLSFHGRRLGRIPMDPTGDWSWTSVSAANRAADASYSFRRSLAKHNDS